MNKQKTLPNRYGTILYCTVLYSKSTMLKYAFVSTTKFNNNKVHSASASARHTTNCKHCTYCTAHIALYCTYRHTAIGYIYYGSALICSAVTSIHFILSARKMQQQASADGLIRISHHRVRTVPCVCATIDRYIPPFIQHTHY